MLKLQVPLNHLAVNTLKLLSLKASRFSLTHIEFRIEFQGQVRSQNTFEQ